MKSRFDRIKWMYESVCVTLLFASVFVQIVTPARTCAKPAIEGTIPPGSMAQEGNAQQFSEITGTRTGAYRTLAQVVYDEYKKGNYLRAAELAHALEVLWDRDAGGEGSKSLKKINGPVYQQADRAMDQFILPVMDYPATKPKDPAAMEAAYKNFIERLKDADSAPVIQAPHVIHLSQDALKTFTGKFQQGGSKRPPIIITANEEGLLMDRGHQDNLQLLPFAATEFFIEEEPSVHLSFTKDEHGQIAEVTMTGNGAPKKLGRLP